MASLCRVLTVIGAIAASMGLMAQGTGADSASAGWTSHFQTTVIAQRHDGFRAKYSGRMSLADSVEPTATSMSTTLFLGRRLWKGAALYLNPEMSGGKGLSYTTGVAGALNGETYRVGEVAPQVFLARAYLQQYFALGTEQEYVKDDLNQLAGLVPTHRITLTVGRFANSDFFDGNAYAKDPRTQFLNWSIWANGAWDYPANTRGYTYGAVAEWDVPNWAIRLASVAVPRIANYHLMEYKFGKAHSETLELEHNHSLAGRPGTLRLTVSNTRSQAPSYKEAMVALAVHDTFLLDVIGGEVERKVYGGGKFGVGLNLEQQLTASVGLFARAGWNDGKDVTWAFTEIDQTLTAGLSIKGDKWKRPDDTWGIAGAANGISEEHRAFLKAGGLGFILGDGTLNYGHEMILETYYSAKFGQFLWVSFDYQFVSNPGYNKDRGPVSVFALRGHVQF